MMYPPLSLYKNYLKHSVANDFSPSVPDVTKKTTLEHMNYGLNLCEKWDNFLDIGGGNGHYSAGLASIFKKGTLAEIEHLQEHVDLVAQYPNIQVVNGFIEDFKIPAKFDFILLADVFEHIVDIRSFTKTLGNLQDTGGVVYMMTPNAVVWGPAPESDIYITHQRYGHIKHYGWQEIELLMNEAGYEMMFLNYEETPFRQKVKRIIFGIARRDKRWKEKTVYKITRPALMPFIKLFLLAVESITYRHEKKYSNSPYVAIEQNLAFKKIHAKK